MIGESENLALKEDYYLKTVSYLINENLINFNPLTSSDLRQKKGQSCERTEVLADSQLLPNLGKEAKDKKKRNKMEYRVKNCRHTQRKVI